MKPVLKYCLLSTLLLCLLPSGRGAAVDYFLKIDGIEGESTDSRHQDQIDLLSFSWGMSYSGTHSGGGGGGAGKVAMQDFRFSMRMNKATPKLMLACATGQHIREAVLVGVKTDDRGERVEFIEVRFSDLLISSYSTSGQGSSQQVPTESVSFNFTKLEVAYTPQVEGRPGEPVRVAIDPELSTLPQ